MGRGGRFVALDPGVHGVKALLGRRTADGIEALECRRISARDEENRLTPAEIREALAGLLEKWGEEPVSLCIPQRLALSQAVDLTGADRAEIRRQIESEIGKVSGLNESPVVFDYAPLRSFGRHGAPYWVTFCQEDELRGQVTTLGLELDDLCEVTTSGNALLAAHLTAHPDTENAALVALGGGGATVTLVYRGQGVYAGAIPIGEDAFTDIVASVTGCSLAAANSDRTERNLLGGGEALPALQSAFDEWRGEIERIVSEWRQEQGCPDEPFPVYVYAGPRPMPGMIERLNETSPFSWSLAAPPAMGVAPGFEIAFGTGLIGAGLGGHGASLVPKEARAVWRRAWDLRRFQVVNFIALFAVAVFLAYGTWLEKKGIRERKAGLVELESSLERTREARSLERATVDLYNSLRPALERQRRSLDTLETLAELEASAVDKGVWYALFADRNTYVSMPEIVVTNAASATNAEPVVPQPSVPAEPGAEVLEEGEGFIAVATVPGERDVALDTVGRLVEDMNRDALFAHVDLLSSDRRRLLVDPAVVVPDRHFVLAIRLPENVFRTPLRGAPKPTSGRAGDGEPVQVTDSLPWGRRTPDAGEEAER